MKPHRRSIAARLKALLDASARSEYIAWEQITLTQAERKLNGEQLAAGGEVRPQSPTEGEIHFVVGAERNAWLQPHGRRLGFVPSEIPEQPTHGVDAESRQPLCGTRHDLAILHVDWERAILIRRCEPCLASLAPDQ